MRRGCGVIHGMVKLVSCPQRDDTTGEAGRRAEALNDGQKRLDLEKTNTLLSATPLTSATTPQAQERFAKLVALQETEIMLILWKKHHTNMQPAWPGPRRRAETERFLRRCRIDDKHNIPTTMATTSTLFDLRELRRSSDICITIPKADKHGAMKDWTSALLRALNIRTSPIRNTAVHHIRPGREWHLLIREEDWISLGWKSEQEQAAEV